MKQAKQNAKLLVGVLLTGRIDIGLGGLGGLALGLGGCHVGSLGVVVDVVDGHASSTELLVQLRDNLEQLLVLLDRERDALRGRVSGNDRDDESSRFDLYLFAGLGLTVGDGVVLADVDQGLTLELGRADPASVAQLQVKC